MSSLNNLALHEFSKVENDYVKLHYILENIDTNFRNIMNEVDSAPVCKCIFEKLDDISARLRTKCHKINVMWRERYYYENVN